MTTTHPRNFTIGQVAQIKTISTYTLRYYDDQGLLPKVFRDKNGNRLFTEEDLQWLDMIKCLKNTGMPLEQIKRFVDATYQGSPTLQARLSLLNQQAKKIKDNIEEQQTYLNQINQKIKTLNNENTRPSRPL
ncbi:MULTISPECIES: MerR family transcriptional regulator [Lactobacillaceae]|uniref:MerR family transcriptional regulator n=1 Tax=Lactobacillaceae TaxID=33958 RepID=UPI001CC1E817|nr:MerR family transcriptional regulator [Lentilactobacillus hilgardii]MBZ2202289.1 MerR family DNA-binding transcriptional regulator [Lentilactobacillus hilgardii]MBZ2205297.1 MerR family transcriptional regulator [Lentilactobacillus hilgardii]